MQSSHRFSVIALLFALSYPVLTARADEATIHDFTRSLCQGLEDEGLERCLDIADIAASETERTQKCTERLELAGEVADLCVNNDYMMRSEKYADRLRKVEACIENAQSKLTYDKYGADSELDKCRELSKP